MQSSFELDAAGTVSGLTVAGPAAPCGICGAQNAAVVDDYRRCRACGHETLIGGGDTSGIVVNDELDPVRLRRADGLVRTQRAVVRQGAQGRRLLVDIGCGSGRFLHHCRTDFDRLLGIELSEPSVAFARAEFGLEVLDALPADLPPPSVVTFWHSLEHIPAVAIADLLGRLGRCCDADSRLLICVPNGASFQSRWFGRAYTYYDVPHHLHQFSPRSLDLLMERHGFEPAGDAFIANYIAFGYTQSLLNLVVPARNYLYQKLKRGVPAVGRGPRRVLAEALSWMLLPMALGLAALLTGLDYLLPGRRGVMTKWYRKRRSNSSFPSTTKANASPS